MSAPLLSFDAVTLRFGGVTALDDVSFTVTEGELFAIIGPNGAGKTSIFNCLNGVYRPESGEITFMGNSLIGAKPTQVAKHGVARTFQNLGLFSNLNLVDNLMLGRHLLMKSGFIAGAIWFGRAKREEIAASRASRGDHRLLGVCSPTATARWECSPTASKNALNWAGPFRWSPVCCCWTNR